MSRYDKDALLQEVVEATTLDDLKIPADKLKYKMGRKAFQTVQDDLVALLSESPDNMPPEVDQSLESTEQLSMRLLRNKKTGVLFTWTPELAKRSGFEEVGASE